MYTRVEKDHMYYQIIGEGDIPVLFLHGWGCSSDIFLPIVKALPDKFRSILVDFHGHGKTAEPSSTYKVSDFTQHVVALLDELELKRVCVVAHSFGGRVAIQLASKFSDRVEKLLITGGAGIILPEKKNISLKTKIYKLQKQILSFLQNLGLPKDWIAKQQERLIQKYGSADYKVLSPSMRETFKAVVNEDLSMLLDDITCPTLLIWGENDTETPIPYAQIMNQHIADSAIIVFEQGDHFAFIQQYQRFRSILENFFGEAS